MRIAIDTGGTFTDCVYLEAGQLRVLKLPSTPSNPAQAVLEGVARITSSPNISVRHGTTVGTNAMLENKGARVAFVTTAGFEDTIAIGRQTRPKLYDWNSPAPACLVPANLRFGVPERTTAEAEILRSPTPVELAALTAAIRQSGAEAIAISLLFAFLRPENELLVEAALQPLGLPISTSHRILPEFREYERASTLVVNAYLAPKMQGYLLNLESEVATRHPGSTVAVMQSSGGIIPATLAAAEPVRTVLSGPAGGVIGAWHLARHAGFDRIIGFDMGGTSTDVFLADATNGGPQLTSESQIAGLPISVPVLDIHTAGAGGGSIARFNTGGLLRVGPESAGADPGPICFGRGTQPTVTDANLLLGRLDTAQFMDGSVTLNTARTREVFTQQKASLPTAEAFAAGILRVVETNMERAIRVISVERGHDPRRFTLVAFGGGGPLHACALARALRVPTVLIPAHPGALSAIGILLADNVRDYSRTVMLPGDQLQNLAAHFATLTPASVDPNAILEPSLDLRYRGQGYELNISHTPNAAEAFHTLHAQRYGFSDPTRPLEIVNLRLRIRIPAAPYIPTPQTPIPGNAAQALRESRPVLFDSISHATPIYTRNKLHPGDTIPGPALITEYTSTTVLPPNCTLAVDSLLNLIIRINP